MTFLEYATLAQVARLTRQRNWWNPTEFEAEINDLLVCLRSLRSTP